MTGLETAATQLLDLCADGILVPRSVMDWPRVDEATEAVKSALQRSFADRSDFWKNAVKNVAEVRIAGEFYICNLCEERSTEFGKHKPDCAWLKARA